MAVINLRHVALRGIWLLGIASVAANADPAKSPSTDGVLASLRGCLLALEKPSDEPIISPCARNDASTLVGASRQAIVRGLGHPNWCTGVDELRFIPWSEQACGTAAIWGYSFYRLPQSWKGGGPELALEFGPNGAVKAASWFATK